jgi:hypothetical protein
VKVTGLSTYAAGTILVGAARLTLIGGLFLLFERIGGSARTAGVASAIYTTNFNFLFWGAQFSYESLALPLLVVVFVMIVEREKTPATLIGEWAVPLIVAIAAIVVTHHLTSYALFVVLVLLAGIAWWFARDWEPPNPWPYALLTLLLIVLWLAVVAGETVSYLSNPLSEAVEALGKTIAGESAPRGLFQGGGPAGPTPIGGWSPCSGSRCSSSAGSSASARAGGVTATGPGRSSSCLPRSGSSPRSGCGWRRRPGRPATGPASSSSSASPS